MFNPQATLFVMSSLNPSSSYRSVPPPHSLHSKNIPPVKKSQIQWSTVKTSPAYVEKLRLLCHSQQELKKEGYILKPLNTGQIEAKLRCIKCGKRPHHKPLPKPASVLVNGVNQTKALTDSNQPFCDEKAGGCGKTGHSVDQCYRLHPELMPKTMRDRQAQKNNRRALAAKDTSMQGAPKADPPLTAHTAPLIMKKRSKACQYHTGIVKDKHFSCCNRHVSKEGCVEDEEHEVLASNDAGILQYWQYHSTSTSTPTPPTASLVAPIPPVSRTRGKNKNRQPQALNPGAVPYTLIRSPATTPSPAYLQAVALDCEMGTSTNSEAELIRLTAVNFFTGAILIDNLVQPAVLMAHYNTRFSGVTPAAMRNAVRTGTAILGRDRARAALLEFVGPETVVIVHGGSGDFSALRWIHPNIVDTFILEGYSGRKVEGGKSLQNLCKVKLGLDVQVRDPAQGKFGHDSYEDAMATRELAIQWVKGIPDS